MTNIDRAVCLRGVGRAFGSLTAVQPTDLNILTGDLLAILGPSGCGKTTLLRMIGGFVQPSWGRIEIGDQDVTDLGPERRPTNMVFQGYGLFPHMNVRQNIAYGLRLRRQGLGAIDRRVNDAIALVRLDGFGEQMVHQLSGGQQQRVALARALVMEPRVLLLDEPLAALDLKLRQAMQDELRRIHRAIGGTFVFVTHDQNEALSLANRVAVMKAGRIEQIGTPEEIYFRPASSFVAAFVGEANLLKCNRSGGQVRGPCNITCRVSGPDGPIVLMIRPESVHPLLPGEVAETEVNGMVEEIVFLGSHMKYTLALEGGQRLLAYGKPEMAPVRVGQTLRVGWCHMVQRVIDENPTPL